MVKLLLILCFTIASAYIDHEHIERYQYFRDHRSRWIQRFIVIISVGALNLFDTIGAALIFAALFDQILNYLNDQELFYLGTEAKWDKFWSNKKIIYKTFKLIALVGGVLLIL